MKRFLLLLLLAFAMWELQAQIPYFASTAGDGKLYGYTSLNYVLVSIHKRLIPHSNTALEIL